MNPCIDYCFNRFGREYYENCDNFCAYAQAERRCAEYQAENEKLRAELKRVKAERDAAINAANELDKIIGRAWGEDDT